VGRGPRNSRLHFGGNLDYNPDPGFLDADFVYYCDSYRQPRIKHENPRRRFELFEFTAVVCVFTRITQPGQCLGTG